MADKVGEVDIRGENINSVVKVFAQKNLSMLNLTSGLRLITKKTLLS